MSLNRREYLSGSLALGLTSLAGPTFAQDRKATLRHLMGGSVNSLDPSALGAARECYSVTQSVYDRLIGFRRKKVDGQWTFDESVIVPELAERVQRSADGLKLTFHLRPDATWHDGTQVTAEDVKWSLDRMVSAKSNAAAQLSSGSMTKTEQFVIAGPNVVEINLPDANRLALPNLGLPFSVIINSNLAKRHASADDPWALDWLKNNAAGSGAYKVETFRPSEQVVLRRHDNWKGGRDRKIAFFERVIAQTVPEPATRANLVERGDADICLDVQASDIASLRKRGVAKILPISPTNVFTHISFNTKLAPFDNPKVRQAIAAALPYEEMFEAAIFGRGRKLFGANWTGEPPTSAFPLPLPNHTDLTRASVLLAEAGHAAGFDTTFTFATGYAAVAEPIAALIKESLSKIGIRVTIQKVPDAQLFTMQAEKKNLPFYIDTGSAWLPETFYFFWIYYTRDQRWNLGNWTNARIVELVTAARTETDAAKYDAYCKEMIKILAEEAPSVLTFQAAIDGVTTPSIDGFTYHYHRQTDYRDLIRT
ncbi:ABC transporter substrate-binding protein [Bradyrhizobium mercantei]|uniref:ABC transporter substrate-binding protein n=1 Tax=Bradyrhizobium mercantei TaxID=1904807 RepID=UPI00097721A9|nr:ABC transporter substrate-binding protein [Bradyrhizobium mercantei]